MNIEIEKVMPNDRNKLENLLQLYLHDLSFYFPISFNSETCSYEYDLDKYFDENYAFFIKLKDEILGFILLDINSNNNYEISEIFVLNNYKNNKVGEEAVTKIFDLYKGYWTVKAVPCSPLAESFWNKIINKYTNGAYKLDCVGKYNRNVFYFTNKWGVLNVQYIF